MANATRTEGQALANERTYPVTVLLSAYHDRQRWSADCVRGFEVQGDVVSVPIHSNPVQPLQLYRWMDYWGYETVSAGYPAPPMGICLNGGRWPWGCLGPLDEFDNNEALKAILRQLDKYLQEPTAQ
jgi:hypothetical protein